MSFTKTFPYETGTIVKVKDKDGFADPDQLGTVSSYDCVRDKSDDFFIWVAGLKEPWCGGFTCDAIILATDEEIEAYCEKRDITEEDIR